MKRLHPIRPGSTRISDVEMYIPNAEPKVNAADNKSNLFASESEEILLNLIAEIIIKIVLEEEL